MLTFHGNSFFFSQNCIKYHVSSVSWRINILSKIDHLYFCSEKRIYAISRKKFLFTEKVIFLMIFCLFHCFSFYFHVLSENEEKCKKYVNVSWQFIFFSQNCLNYPVSSVFCRINILSKKNAIFILVQKKGIYAISRKKSLFTEKVNFSMIFFLFHCFDKKINKKI